MIHVCGELIYIGMKSPKTVRQHWVYKTLLDKGERRDGALDFRSENEAFTGS